MEKTCYKCKQLKLADEFSKDTRSKDGLCAACRACRSELKKQYYNREHDGLRIKQLEKRRKLQDWVSTFKKECSVCGEDHPACLDFHHDGEKEAGIANMINRNNMTDEMRSKVLAEIAKCKVLCSNCHRKLHWKERREGPFV